MLASLSGAEYSGRWAVLRAPISGAAPLEPLVVEGDEAGVAGYGVIRALRNVTLAPTGDVLVHARTDGGSPGDDPELVFATASRQPDSAETPRTERRHRMSPIIGTLPPAGDERHLLVVPGAGAPTALRPRSVRPITAGLEIVDHFAPDQHPPERAAPGVQSGHGDVYHVGGRTALRVVADGEEALVLFCEPQDIVVNSIADLADTLPGDGVCSTGRRVAGIDGDEVDECTLRAAIEEANASRDQDLIEFAIPSVDARGDDRRPVIAVSSELPAVRETVEIDASAQGAGRVLVDGRLAVAETSGLVVDADACVVRGLSFSGFGQHGVVSLATGLTLGELAASENGGAGVFAPGGALRFEGDVAVSRNRGDGIVATGDVSLDGVAHVVSQNGLAGISSEGTVRVSGAAEIDGNGVYREPASCAYLELDLENAAGIVAGEHVIVEAITCRDNCGSGIVARSGSVITNDAIVVGNTGDGIRAPAGDVTLRGASHDLSRNQGLAIFTSTGDIELVGPARVANNGGGLDPVACHDGPAAALFAEQGRISAGELAVTANCGGGIFAMSVRLGHATISGHELDGIRAIGSVRVERADITDNGGDGVRAYAVTVFDGEICRNQGYGIAMSGEGALSLGTVELDCGNVLGELFLSGGVLVRLPPQGGVSAESIAPPAAPPAGVELPLGAIDVRASASDDGEGDGQGAGPLPRFAIEIVVEAPAIPPIDTWLVYGATAGDPEVRWRDFDFDGATGARSQGDAFVLRFVDGTRGDTDREVDGSIVSIVAPAVLSGAATRFVRGETNGDGAVDISDAVSVLLHLFAGTVAITCEDAADTNDDGAVDVSDALTLLAHFFAGGIAPRAPFTSCGIDLTGDAIGCEAFAECGGR